jgi:hypothetical protein
LNADCSEPLDLTWTINEGVLLITTLLKTQGQPVDHTKVYEVSDLIKFQTKDGETWEDYDSLIQVITSNIQPDSWDAVGGAGSH